MPRCDQLDPRHVTVYKADVIKTFADKRTRDLYVTGRARRLPADLATRAARKLEYVDLATRLDDLKVPPGNRLHALDGDRKGHMRSRSTISGESAFGSSMVTPTTSSSATTTRSEG